MWWPIKWLVGSSADLRPKPAGLWSFYRKTMTDIPDLNSPTAKKIFRWMATHSTNNIRGPLHQAFVKLIEGDREGALKLMYEALTELDKDIDIKYRLTEDNFYQVLRAQAEKEKHKHLPVIKGRNGS